MVSKINHLLNLHHEMDKFEAVYLELHTHMAARIPQGGGLSPSPTLSTHTVPTTREADSGMLALVSDYPRPALQPGQGKVRLDVAGLGTRFVVANHDPSHTNPHGATSECVGPGARESCGMNSQTPSSMTGMDQDTGEGLWFYLTAISLIFNRMKYFLYTAVVNERGS